MLLMAAICCLVGDELVHSLIVAGLSYAVFVKELVILFTGRRYADCKCSEYSDCCGIFCFKEATGRIFDGMLFAWSAGRECSHVWIYAVSV